MLWIGTSGWQYAHWKQTFYPAQVAQKEWLAWYAERFRTVELNNSFYHLPQAATFASWRRRTPPDFVFAVKASRFLTHVKRLKDPEEPIARFMQRAGELGEKLGPVLIQLPPQMHSDVDRLSRTLSLFPAGVRVAVEFRHPSWFTDGTRNVLERAGAALCWADSPRRLTPTWKTTEWGFIRFHHGLGDPQPCYPREVLREWSARLAGTWTPDQDVFAFFNNDPRACALRDAVVFAELAQSDGMKPTRVAAPAAVTVA